MIRSSTASYSSMTSPSNPSNSHRHDARTQPNSEQEECPEMLKRKIEEYVQIDVGAYAQVKIAVIRDFLDELDARCASLQNSSYNPSNLDVRPENSILIILDSIESARVAHPTLSEASNSTHNRGLKSMPTNSDENEPLKNFQKSTRRGCGEHPEVIHGQTQMHNCFKKQKLSTASKEQASLKKFRETSRLSDNDFLWLIYNVVLAKTSDWTPKDRPSATLVNKEVLYLTPLLDGEGATNLLKFIKAVREVGENFHPNIDSPSSMKMVKVPRIFLDTLSSHKEYKPVRGSLSSATFFFSPSDSIQSKREITSRCGQSR